MVRVEKVLQGGITACAEPYMKSGDNIKVLVGLLSVCLSVFVCLYLIVCLFVELIVCLICKSPCLSFLFLLRF